MRSIRENLGWAFGTNVIGIPVARRRTLPFTGWLLARGAGLAVALFQYAGAERDRLHGRITWSAAGPAGSGNSTADVGISRIGRIGQRLPTSPSAIQRASASRPSSSTIAPR